MLHTALERHRGASRDPEPVHVLRLVFRAWRRGWPVGTCVMPRCGATTYRDRDGSVCPYCVESSRPALALTVAFVGWRDGIFRLRYRQLLHRPELQQYACARCWCEFQSPYYAHICTDCEIAVATCASCGGIGVCGCPDGSEGSDGGPRTSDVDADFWLPR